MERDESWLETVRAFALEAHGDQTYGAGPYGDHLDEVVAILREFGWDRPETLAAGYLHDVVEDTAVSHEELADAFGLEVSGMVAFCSDEEGESRAARKAATYVRMQSTIEQAPTWIVQAVAVKLSDRLANVRRSTQEGHERLVEMYRREHEVFEQTLGGFSEHRLIWEELSHRLEGESA